MKHLFLLFLLLAPLVSLSGQVAQLGLEKTENLLVWPFANSYPIDFFSGSHGWTMANGAGGGLHQTSDYFALDWLRPNAPTCGIPFKAPLNGTVIWAGGSNEGYGKQLVIQSAQDTNYAFRIAHLQSYSVSQGAQVQVGDIIGHIGDTGNGPCHGHLVLYHKIYDRVDLPQTAADSAARPAVKAIDLLRKGSFIVNQGRDRTYFAAPFRFLASEDGIEVLKFHTTKQAIGNRDTLTASVRLVNRGTKSWQGKLSLSFQSNSPFNYYLGFPPNIAEDQIFRPGDTIEVQLKQSSFGLAPGAYLLYLGLISKDTLPGAQRGYEVATILGQIPVDIYSPELCQQEEPNDLPLAATSLYRHPLKDRTPERTKTSYISPLDDHQDVYVFSSKNWGRFFLKNIRPTHFQWKISTADGKVNTHQKEQETFFYTAPNQDYYLTISGPPSCLSPYHFTYYWVPEKVLEWTPKYTQILENRFEILEPLEIEWIVIDMLGRRLWRSGKKQLDQGIYQFSNDIPLYQSGIYQVILLVDGQIIDQHRFFKP